MVVVENDKQSRDVSAPADLDTDIGEAARLHQERHRTTADSEQLMHNLTDICSEPNNLQGVMRIGQSPPGMF